MEQERLTHLLKNSLAENASEEEHLEMMDLINDPANEARVKEELYHAYQYPKSLQDISPEKKGQILEAIFQSDVKLQSRKSVIQLNTIKWTMTIAAAVALIAFGLYFFNYQRKTAKPDIPQLAGDIAPGSYGATLTLTNGKIIKLADVSNGELAKESGISISKTADGKLVYSIEETAANPNQINVLSTAKGETYEIRLPDGSSVHLNAASSLTYKPSLIEGGKRVVKLSGEGYFEVAKDKVHPFVVKTDDQEVEVLGTHFNISSYANDELEKTTLLEGSVRLSTPFGSRILRPGQQSSVRDGKITIADTDTDLAVAWKNNEFVFESETVENIMKMVERWYNVEVIYVGGKTNGRFSGGVSRFDNISKVLQILEDTGAGHFKVQGRKIYVSK